jgi:TonB family protein
MRKAGVFLALGGWTAVLGLLWATNAPMTARAQDAAAANADSKALMIQAARSNSLTGADVQPWHLKASLQLFDLNGKISDQGTYEEFWAGAAKHKYIFTSSGFNQTEYTTDKGVLRAGTRDMLPIELAAIRRQLIDPTELDDDAIQHLTLALKERGSGGPKLECITVTATDAPDKLQRFVGNAFCVDSKSPVMRISMHAGTTAQVLRNNVIRFQDRYVAQDIQSLFSMPGDKPRTIYSVHVESVELLKTSDDAVFAPSADALPVPKRIEMSEDATKRMLVQHPKPVYPAIAKALCARGTVVLRATISIDGRIESVGVLSGSPVLQGAAIDAVKKWIFKPFTQDGEPVEVVTTISVPFVLPMGAGPAGPCG